MPLPFSILPVWPSTEGATREFGSLRVGPPLADPAAAVPDVFAFMASAVEIGARHRPKRGVSMWSGSSEMGSRDDVGSGDPTGSGDPLGSVGHVGFGDHIGCVGHMGDGVDGDRGIANSSPHGAEHIVEPCPLVGDRWNLERSPIVGRGRPIWDRVRWPKVVKYLPVSGARSGPFRATLVGVRPEGLSRNIVHDVFGWL